MHSGSQHSSCPTCGNPVQLEDKFCGSCGAVVLPPTPQAEQVVPEPAAAQGTAAYVPRRRKRLWINVAAASVLLLVVGSVAALALNSGLELLGSSDPQPASDGGNEPAPKEGTGNTASVSPDSPPDPAFDSLLPTLRERTDAPIMLPAKLPDEMDLPAIDGYVGEDVEGYGIVFPYGPQEVIAQVSNAETLGTLRGYLQEEDRANEFFDAESIEEVVLPDGTEATLRYMVPAGRSGSQGPFWEGKFDKEGFTYVLTVVKPNEITEEEVRQTFSSMVLVKGSGDEGADTPEPNPDEEALEEFGYEYDEANRGGDWERTYAMLDEGSQQEFTEEEWAEKQQALRDADGPLSPLQSVSVDLPEGVSDTSGNVILYYQDGTSDTIVAGIPMAVTSEEEAGEPKRTLTEEEISYLEQVSTDAGTDDRVAEAEEAAGDYYRAAGSQDWNYTYDALDSETQALFSREEWFEKNQWLSDNYPAIYNIETVELDETSQEPLAEVAVRLTGEDGSSSIRNTYFVLEGGEWKHRFAQEEIDLFGPGVPFDEWVDDR